MSSMYHVDRHTFTVIFEPTGGFQRNYTFSSKFIYFSVIEVGSLFKLPKRYTDPEPRTEYVVLDDCYYTAVVTFHISGALWSQLWSSSIVLYNNTSNAQHHHTNNLSSFVFQPYHKPLYQLIHWYRYKEDRAYMNRPPEAINNDGRRDFFHSEVDTVALSDRTRMILEKKEEAAEEAKSRLLGEQSDWPSNFSSNH